MEFKVEYSPPPVSPPATIYDTDNCAIKTIDDFKVMRKYLKNTNKAEFIVDKNIIKTEKYSYSELILEEN